MVPRVVHKTCLGSTGNFFSLSRYSSAMFPLFSEGRRRRVGDRRQKISFDIGLSMLSSRVTVHEARCVVFPSLKWSQGLKLKSVYGRSMKALYVCKTAFTSMAYNRRHSFRPLTTLNKHSYAYHKGLKLDPRR